MTPSVIFLKDVEGRYLMINWQFKKCHNISLDEDPTGITAHNFLPAEVADILCENDRLILEKDRPKEFEELIPLEDGIHTYIAAKFPLHDKNGNPYAVCGVSTDISEMDSCVS